MPEFLVETYTPALDRRARSRMIRRARAAAAALTRDGETARHLRAIHVPDDATCFHLFDAPSADVVERIVAVAGLTATRISEAAG
jgi:hypothetical protein